MRVLPESMEELVHEKTVEILTEVGFCVPEEGALARLKAAGFQVDDAACMVRITPELLERALDTLPRDVRLYDRDGGSPVPYDRHSCFMGGGTPVNVLDLDTGQRRPATHRDVVDLVRLQDALPGVEVVRPTVTATDWGPCSDLVEIAELLRCTAKPGVHRCLSADRVDAAVEMLDAVSGARRSRPSFATLYCPISPGYFTPENVRCMLRWAEHGVPITLLSMAMGGASAPATLLGELVVINADVLAWIVALQILHPGTPLLYGSVSAVLDMRTGLLPLGAPERGMVNAGAARMARHYGIPSMCGGLSSDAKQLDAQADLLRKIMALGKTHGVTPNLHNHTYEVVDNLHDLKGTLARIPDVKLGPDLNWLVRGGVDPVAFIRQYGKQIVFDILGDLYLLPIEGGEAKALTHSIAWEMQARFSPDGKHLAAGLNDGTVRIWSCATGEMVLVLDAGCRLVRDVTFSPSGHLLASAGDNGLVKIWEYMPRAP